MVKVVTLFKMIIMLSVIILLGYFNMFSNALNEHISGISFIIACLGFIMALYVKSRRNHEAKRICKALDQYVIPFFFCVIIATINTYVSYDYSLKNVIFEFTNFFYIFFAYPLAYISLKDNKSTDFLELICKLVLVIIIIKFISWILYSFFGIVIFERILFQYEDWIRDGRQRIDTGYLFGITYSYYLYNAFKPKSKIIYKIITAFLLAFMIFVTRYRVLIIVMVLTSGIVFFVSAKRSKEKAIRVLILLFAFIAIIMSGALDRIIDSFSLIGNRSGSTLGRLLSLYHYWDLLIQKKAVFGLGFLNASVSNMAYKLMVRDSWRIFYIGDAGIFGGFVWFGVLGFVVYGLLFGYAIRICIKTYRLKREPALPLLIGAVSYMLISCIVFNIFDAQRSFDAPFYLSVIALYDFKLHDKQRFFSIDEKI